MISRDTPSINELLSYPDDTFLLPISPTEADHVIKEKLYVGNLHPSVDEYALIKLFSQYGKVTSLDYLFHKSGLMKGKPRGFAFVQYASSSDAEAALNATHDKLLKGRKIAVTYANQTSSGSLPSLPPLPDANKHTTLSLLKTGGISRKKDKFHSTTASKIAQMEAKLVQMGKTREDGSVPPMHHSLPDKPIVSGTSHDRRIQRPLRSQPLSLPPSLPPTTTINLPGSSSGIGKGSKHTKTSLVGGVRFKKGKSSG